MFVMGRMTGSESGTMTMKVWTMRSEVTMALALMIPFLMTQRMLDQV